MFTRSPSVRTHRGGRDPVGDVVVHADAGGAGEVVGELGRRAGTVSRQHLAPDVVELRGRDTRHGGGEHRVTGLGDGPPAAQQGLDVVVVLGGHRQSVRTRWSGLCHSAAKAGAGVHEGLNMTPLPLPLRRSAPLVAAALAAVLGAACAPPDPPPPTVWETTSRLHDSTPGADSRASAHGHELGVVGGHRHGPVGSGRRDAPALPPDRCPTAPPPRPRRSRSRSAPVLAGLAMSDHVVAIDHYNALANLRLRRPVRAGHHPPTPGRSARPCRGATTRHG